MNYSRRQLEAFGEPLGESATRSKPFGRIYGGGGGGGGPTSSTVTQTTIPEYLRPQVEGLLGGSMQELFNFDKSQTDADGRPIYNIAGTKSFVPYSYSSKDYLAGFQPLQVQSQANAANLGVPLQYARGSDFANTAGVGGMDSANQAGRFGQSGFQSGQVGQNIGGVGGQLYGGMGAGYGANAAGSASAAQSYGQAGYNSGQIGQQLALDASQRYGAMGSGYGASAAALAPQAQQYGQSAADIGRMGLRAESLGQDITGQARGYAAQQAAAGQDYARQMTSPSAIQQYMSPYQSAVTDVQIQAAQRQADIAAQTRKSAAARAGAFGGSRQAIENAEANRALASQMDMIRAQGQQAAYDKAVQAMQYGSNLGLQGLGGAQSGLGTALQGGQLGLSGIGQAMAGQQAGISGLNQAGNLYGLGMQGAGMGLQAAQTGLQGTAQGMQGAQAGLSGVNAENQAYQTGIQGAGMGLQGVNAQLAGTAQGIQGAQSGLAGVGAQQAGYGLTGQMAGTLGQLGDRQLASQQNIINMQNQLGGQQQAYEQQLINQSIQNYQAQREAPLNAFNQFNALLRGYALPGQTTNQYQAQPNIGSQIAGLGTAGIAGLGLYNASQPRG